MTAPMTPDRLHEIEGVLLETREHLMDTEEATILECVREIRRLQASEHALERALTMAHMYHEHAKEHHTDCETCMVAVGFIEKGGES